MISVGHGRACQGMIVGCTHHTCSLARIFAPPLGAPARCTSSSLQAWTLLLVRFRSPLANRGPPSTRPSRGLLDVGAARRCTRGHGAGERDLTAQRRCETSSSLLCFVEGAPYCTPCTIGMPESEEKRIYSDSERMRGSDPCTRLEPTPS